MSRTRGAVVRWAVILAAAGCGGNDTGPSPPAPPPPPPPTALPETGQVVPELASFDRIYGTLMQRWKVPGGAIAVGYQGRLVYARGFGYADTLTKALVQPAARFRIASVSKPITAVAILKLAEQGKLDLDARAFDLLPDLTPFPGATVDPRIATITVKELLWHTAGWDRDLSGDPIFQNQTIAAAIGQPAPLPIGSLIRYMLGRPLDFDPGARFAYSNLGYSVLGRIVEAASGQSYASYVQSAVLGPAGITRIALGRTRPADRPADEVHYYDRFTAPSVFADGTVVPYPDGGFYLESMDSHGGWTASAVDLVRFLMAVDGLATRPDVLLPASLDLMLAPAPSIWSGSDYFYGLGWLVRPAPGHWWHDGSLPGTSAFVARLANGVTVALVFNAREMVPLSQFGAEIDSKLGEALLAVTAWPGHDLFGQYP